MTTSSPFFRFSTVAFGGRSFKAECGRWTETRGRESDTTKLLRIFVAVTLLIGVCFGAEAEIVAFTDGRVLKVDDAYLEGDAIVIELRGGGTLQVPATRVERVVADEIDDDPVPVPAPTHCPWAWDGETLPDEMPFSTQIDAAARRAGVHPWLLVALVRAESNFDPLAVSRAGASGLAQLMPATAAETGVADVFDPADNLRGGAAYLRTLLDRFDSLTLALAAYNAGPATVDRFNGVPPYRETRQYVRKITLWYCGGAAD